MDDFQPSGYMEKTSFPAQEGPVRESLPEQALLF
jgi:hypothetical protein